MIKFLALTKSLGFGAMLGAGTFGLLLLSLPHRFPANASPSLMVLVGTLIGAGVHLAIEALLAPIVYYLKLFQLLVLRRARIITEKQKKDLIDQLTRKYFEPKQRE